MGTSYLIHSPYYTDMQHNLHETLQIVNRQIFVINNENFVETPNLAGFITTKRGEGKGYRVRYERLKDGCHPVKEIITEWQNVLVHLFQLQFWCKHEEGIAPHVSKILIHGYMFIE